MWLIYVLVYLWTGFPTALAAATFSTAEATRRDDVELASRCRSWALAAGAVTGATALVGIVPLEHDAPTLFHGLTGRALPLVLGSAAAGVTSLVALARRHDATARVAAVLAVVAAVFVVPSLAWLFWLTQRPGWAAAESRHRRE